MRIVNSFNTERMMRQDKRLGCPEAVCWEYCQRVVAAEFAGVTRPVSRRCHCARPNKRSGGDRAEQGSNTDRIRAESVPDQTELIRNNINMRLRIRLQRKMILISIHIGKLGNRIDSSRTQACKTVKLIKDHDERMVSRTNNKKGEWQETNGWKAKDMHSTALQQKLLFVSRIISSVIMQWSRQNGG
jgi:hypothetical protein